MSFTHSDWKILDGKKYVRPLDGMEKVWYNLSTKGGVKGQRAFDLILMFQITVDLLSLNVKENSKKAWRRMRAMHPGITASTKGDEWIYKISNDDEKAEWHRQTFFMVDSPHSAQYYVGSLKCPEYPTLYYLERTQEFIIHTAHYYMDGRGAGTLMHDFLLELSRPSSLSIGDETDRLPMSAAGAIGTPLPSQDLIDNLISESAIAKDNISLTRAGEPSTPGTSAVFGVSLSLVQTARVAKRAKLNGVSLSHFVHAALILAARHQRGYAPGAQYSSFVATDLRHLCQGPFATGGGAVSVRMGWWPMSVEVNDLWTTAQKVREEYDRISTQKERYLPAMAPCVAKISSEPDTQIFNSIMVTSMGDTTPFVKGPYDGFKVTNMWGTALAKGQVVSTHFRILFGEMELTTAYNEAFHSTEQLKSLLSLAKDIMICASTTQPRL